MIHGVLMLSKDFEDPGEGRGVQKLRASLFFKEFCDFIFGYLLKYRNLVTFVDFFQNPFIFEFLFRFSFFREISPVKTRGVSHCGLAIYIKKYLKAKEEL